MKVANFTTKRMLVSSIAAAILLAVVSTVRSERLPIKSYTIADGIGGDHVRHIIQDSRGFLWFCTSEGLSRFDGYSFVTYGTQHGLPYPAVTCMIETRKGHYWVGTGRGVSRFSPRAFQPSQADRSNQSEGGRLLFTNYKLGESSNSNSVLALHEDKAGRIWAGTVDGLYRLDEASGDMSFKLFDLKPVSRPTEFMHIEAIAEDGEGNLWVGTSWGLIIIFADGSTSHFSTLPDGKIEPVRPLMTDYEGRVWIGHMTGGLVIIKPDAAIKEKTTQSSPVLLLANMKDITPGDGPAQLPASPGEFCHYTTRHGLAENNILSLWRTSNGKVWIGSVEKGLTEFDGKQFRTFTQAEGLSDNSISALCEDAAGNLWVGTEAGGAMRLAVSGLVSYTTADGLGHNRATSIVEDRAGDLYVVSGFGNVFINRYDGRGFAAIEPMYSSHIKSGGIKSLGWGYNQITFQDSAGQWWVPTGEGLCVYPTVSRFLDLIRTPPVAVYTTRDGLPDNNIFRLFEDSRGDVWISTIFPHKSAVARWSRATAKIEDFSAVPEISRLGAATAFCEDGSGNLWVGFYEGGLARHSKGKWQSFAGVAGFPTQRVDDLYLDRKGRLWVATLFGGAARLDNPAADQPDVVYYTTANGLASDYVRAITGDESGFIYIATSRGIDRLDADTGNIKRYTAADGLIGSRINAAFRDRHGALWFATLNGVSRLAPEILRSPSPPPILITGLRIEGDSSHISELGEVAISGMELKADSNNIEIDFVSINLAQDQSLRYQYKLEGADADWSEPTDNRSISYANLPPGSYRFLVRAINGSGLASERPASFYFTILPPVWQRWWFLALAAAAIGLFAYAAYRYRVNHLIALERVRTRIATDLHDDIGSSLSQIAILSEVTRGQATRDEAEISGPLSTIAATSRELVDSMADIVWAINPQKDYLRNLTQRMRRFASDTFTACNIEFTFKAPSADGRIKLDADMRRQVFLIFKESVNNIARHSGCAHAEIEFRVEGSRLVLTLADNGRGLAASSESDGHGLASMRERAKSLGGEFSVNSNNGAGTTATLQVPLARPFRLKVKKNAT